MPRGGRGGKGKGGGAAALADLQGWSAAVSNDWLPEDGGDDEEGGGGFVLPSPVVVETDAAREKREEDEEKLERELLEKVAPFEPNKGWIVVEALPDECLCPGVPAMCPQTSSYLKKREVAFKLASGWECGSVHVQEKSKANKGYFSIKIPGKTGWILYDLKKETYGVDKAWVLVTRDAPMAAMRTVAQMGLG